MNSQNRRNMEAVTSRPLMTIMRRLISLAIVVCIAATTCSCGIGVREGTETNKIKRTLNSFQRNCNKMNVRGVIGCIYPEYAKILDAISIPKDLQSNPDILESILDVLYIADEDIAENVIEFFESLRLDIDEIDLEKRTRSSPTRAKVSARLLYSIAGEEYSQDVTITMLKDRRNWYIAFVTF